LDEFPRFKGRDFWLTGESYAGMYIPTFAYNILTGSDAGIRDQFKGWMLGNPVIFCQSAGLNSDGYYFYQFNRFFYNGLISYSNYNKWRQLGCNDQITSSCVAYFNQVEQQIGVIDQQLGKAKLDGTSQPDLDPDDLYQDFCSGNGTLNQAHPEGQVCDPSGAITVDYLNRPDVQAALHAKVGTDWSVCATLDYNSNLAAEGLIPFLKKIFTLKPSLNILYYSGDIDVSTVPLQVTQACLAELSGVTSLTQGWRPWRVNGWHAGYVENFDRYTFATVKGAGHEVPTYQPFFSLKMFQRFLQQQTLDEDVVKRPYTRSPRQGDVIRSMFHQPFSSTQ